MHVRHRLAGDDDGAATYSEWLDLVTRLVPGEDERRAVLAGTAERVYRAFSLRPPGEP